MTHLQISHPDRGDIATLGEIAGANLFPAEMMDGMITPFLDGASDQTWQVAEYNGVVVGFAFAEAEPMSDRVWNLRAIAVSEQARGKGAGRALLTAIENGLEDVRMIVIDTTQLPDQAAGRHLYESCGYALAATIPDFWEDGADKVTFSKRL